MSCGRQCGQYSLGGFVCVDVGSAYLHRPTHLQPSVRSVQERDDMTYSSHGAQNICSYWDIHNSVKHELWCREGMDSGQPCCILPSTEYREMPSLIRKQSNGSFKYFFSKADLYYI
jgi:hypothetical protein